MMGGINESWGFMSDCLVCWSSDHGVGCAIRHDDPTCIGSILKEKVKKKLFANSAVLQTLQSGFAQDKYF